MELILTHINADFDGLASVLAAGKLYPNAHIFLPGSQEYNVRDFIKQYPDLFPKLVKARFLRNKLFEKIILVDVSTAERLGEFRRLLDQGTPVIISYDHHPDKKNRLGTHGRYCKKVGANTTILIQALQEKKIILTAMEATLLALGLYEETGNFTYTSTCSEDLAAAGFLISQGADLTIVSEYMKRPFRKEQQLLFEDLIKSRITRVIQGVEISLVQAQREVFIEDLAVIVNRIKELENLPVLFALCRMHARTYVIARSSFPGVDGGKILTAFQGGGHATAASAVLKNTDISGLRRKLLARLKHEIPKTAVMASIMSAPVVSVTAAATVVQARKMMMRFRHSGLPVTDKNQLVGIVTLHDLDKAYHHGLEQVIVQEVMRPQPVTAGPEETLSSVRRKMIDKNISYLPIVTKGKICGIVTKSDILRHGREEEFYPVIKSYFSSWEEGPLDRAQIRRMLQERLPERVVTLLHTAGEVADHMGIKAYVVGGFVRDIILQVENLDVDIMVEGDGIAYAAVLAERVGGHAKSHERFGTAKIHCRGSFVIDVASARTEYYVSPAALPQVEAASLKYDLFRRDFTVNAMAISINPGRFGELVDYFGGLHDLHAGLIRVLYALSFVDDPTRIFRAIRFSQRFGFAIEPDTRRYIQHALKRDLMGKLSRPRLFDELMLILKEDQPLKALRCLDQLRLWPWIHPALKSMKKVLAHVETVWETFAFVILFLEDEIDQSAVYLMTLLTPLSTVQMLELAKRCQFPKKITEMMLVQKKTGDRAVDALGKMAGAQAMGTVRRLKNIPVEVLLYEMNRNRKQPAGQLIRKYLTRWRDVKIYTTGRDLKKMGYTPGPVYERILKKMLALRLERKIITRQDEIKYLRKNFPL